MGQNPHDRILYSDSALPELCNSGFRLKIRQFLAKIYNTRALPLSQANSYGCVDIKYKTSVPSGQNLSCEIVFSLPWQAMIFNLYGLGWIKFGYIDYFMIRIKDFYKFTFGPWVLKNPQKTA